LIAEGASDVAFLLPLLQAQSGRMAWDVEFDARRIQRSPVTAVMPVERVAAEASELLESVDLPFVHRDDRESAKIARLCGRIPVNGRVVGVVPVRETEARVLAAAITARATTAVPGLDLESPERGIRWVEKLADPKAEGEDTGGTVPVEDLFTLIGERADLDRLAELAAYRTFLQDLTTVLKELNFR
jgi:hypothetical protein